MIVYQLIKKSKKNLENRFYKNFKVEVKINHINNKALDKSF